MPLLRVARFLLPLVSVYCSTRITRVRCSAFRRRTDADLSGLPFWITKTPMLTAAGTTNLFLVPYSAETNVIFPGVGATGFSFCTYPTRNLTSSVISASCSPARICTVRTGSARKQERKTANSRHATTNRSTIFRFFIWFLLTLLKPAEEFRTPSGRDPICPTSTDCPYCPAG